jgi:hypothetical protein
MLTAVKFFYSFVSVLNKTFYHPSLIIHSDIFARKLVEISGLLTKYTQAAKSMTILFHEVT